MPGSSVTVSKSFVEIGRSSSTKRVQIVNIDWVADDTDGSVPNTNIDLRGWVIKAITNPGATAPTTLYDLAMGDPEDTVLDALEANLADRSATVTEQVNFTLTGALTPPLFAGTYQFQLTNNSVNDATGRLQLYLVDDI